MRAGKITEMRVDRKTHRALVDFEITKAGFGSLREDVFCESRPQSLIGEYFIDCKPGKGEKLASGRDDPGRADRVDDPGRPDQQHHAPPVPRAARDHPRRARRRRRRPRRGHQGDASAAPARRCARPTACSPSSRTRTRSLAQLVERRRHGDRRHGRQPPRHRPLGDRDQGDRAGVGRAARRHPRQPPAPARLPARAAAHDGRPRRRVRRADARPCATSTPPPASSPASWRTSSRSRRPAR